MGVLHMCTSYLSSLSVFGLLVWGPSDSFFSEVLALSSLILLASSVAVLSISSYVPLRPLACLSFSVGSL